MDVLVYLGVGFIVGSAAGMGASQHLRGKQLRQQQMYLEQVLQEANHNLDRNFDLRLERSITHWQEEHRQQYHLYDQHLKEQESRLQSQIIAWQNDYQSHLQRELSVTSEQQKLHLQQVIQSLQADYANQLKKLVSDWKKSQNARLQEWERRQNTRLETLLANLTDQQDDKLRDAINVLQNQREDLLLKELDKFEKVYETRLQDRIHLLRQEYDLKLQEQVIVLNEKNNITWQNSFQAWEAKQDIKLQQSIKQVEENYQRHIGELIQSLKREQQGQLEQTQKQLEQNYQERLQTSLTILQTEYEGHIRQLIEQRSVISDVSSDVSKVVSHVTDTISHTIEGYQLGENLPADQLNNSNNFDNSNIPPQLDNNTVLNGDILDEPVSNGIMYGNNLADQLVDPTPVNWKHINKSESGKFINDQGFHLVNSDSIINNTNGTNSVNGVNGINTMNTNGKYLSNETADYDTNNHNHNIPTSFSLNASEVIPIISSDTGESTVLTPSLSSINWDERNHSYSDQNNYNSDHLDHLNQLDQDYWHLSNEPQSDKPEVVIHTSSTVNNGCENVSVKLPNLKLDNTADRNSLVHGKIDHISQPSIDFTNKIESVEANINGSNILNHELLHTREMVTNTIGKVNDNNKDINNNNNDYPLILLFARLILFVGICGVVLDNVKQETAEQKQCDLPSLPIDLI